MKARFNKAIMTPIAAVALSAAMLVATTGVATASIDAKGSKKKFCEQALKLGTDVTQPSPDATSVPEDTAADLERAFKKLSKAAPSKALKNATATIASYYGELADGSSPADLSAEEGEAYGNATAKFATYLATKCISEVIPDITLPGGGEIDIPGT